MRLFVAIKLNDEIKNAVTELQDRLRENSVRGRYSNVNNLHLTLAFIGEYDDPNVVMEALEKVRFKSFTLKLNGHIGKFGDVLWTGLEKNDDLQNLAEDIRRSFVENNIPFDKKKYNPHITMMRKTLYYKDISEIKADKAEMKVESFVLMCTLRDKKGVFYREVGVVYSEDNQALE